MPYFIKVLLLSLTVLQASNPSTYAKCDASDPKIGDQLKSINKKWEELSKVIKSIQLVGKEAKRGTCAITLVRVGASAPFALPPYEATREAHEAISCLALEKWYLQEQCKCGDLGLRLSRDEASETATRAVYKNVQTLRAQATKVGIPNKAIRSLVERADETKSCFDMSTVAILRSIELDLQRVIDAGQSSR